MNGKKYAMSVKSIPGAPAGYAEAARESARRKVGVELLAILKAEGTPAVIDVQEYTKEHTADSAPYYYFFHEEEHVIEVTVQPVRYHDVVVPRYAWKEPKRRGKPVGGRPRRRDWLQRARSFVRKVMSGKYW